MTPNARHQAAYRARYAKRGKALVQIIIELGEPEGEKGRRILAIATDGLQPEKPK